jgi:hypothetical protein
MENTDDEALSWAGDESRQRGGGTWSVPKRREGASLSPSPTFEAVDEKAPRASGESGDSAAETVRSSVGDQVALFATGILAGVYLLFSIAWLITALRDPIKIADPLGNAMFVIGLWMAVAAGPVVFVAALIAGRNRHSAVRLILLVAGALVLLPWPYFSWAG